MGGHPEEPLPPLLGEEGPGAGGSLPPGAAGGGVGEDQRHHSSGGSGDHGPADGGVSSAMMMTMKMKRSWLGEEEDEDHLSVLYHGVLSAHPLVCLTSGSGGRLMSSIATVST